MNDDEEKATGGRSFKEIEEESELRDRLGEQAKERALLGPLVARLEQPRDHARFIIVDKLERQICESLLSAWTAAKADTPEAALLYLASAFRSSGMLAVFSGSDGWRFVHAGPQDPTGWPDGSYEVMQRLLAMGRS